MRSPNGRSRISASDSRQRRCRGTNRWWSWGSSILYAVVELVEFLEKNWNIAILNEEITREKMGSLNKMAALILQKRGAG